MNPLATELNNAIQEESPQVYSMLSKFGQQIYMPKGILTQSAQAKEKAYKYNATIGIATIKKQPMYLDCVMDSFNGLAPSEVLTYASTTGIPELRKLWKDKIFNENPSLTGKTISTPVVTTALTHGLSVVADLFCDSGDYVVLPDKFWGNYRLIFQSRKDAVFNTFPMFDEDMRFNVKGFLEKVEECGKLKSKVIVLLNFPNNPIGYTVTPNEADELTEGLKQIADSGVNIIVAIDDAYFGMFYEDSIKESIFARLAGISKNLLAVKVDGATKESFVWGLRVGFLTFAAPADTPSEKTLPALEKKVAGCIRSIISSSAHSSQSIVLKALKDPNYAKQHDEKVKMLKERAMKAKKVVNMTKYHDQFTPYPFNSGYFLTVKLNNVDSEELRNHLLDKYGVGTISMVSTDLRVAFSCIEVEELEDLFDIIYKGCLDLNKNEL